MKRFSALLILAGLVLTFSCNLLDTGTIMQPGTGRVCVKAEPASAEVYVDGRLQGKANEFMDNPDCLNLAAGRRHIEITKSGFDNYSSEVNVNSNSTQWVNAKLGKGKGK